MKSFSEFKAQTKIQQVPQNESCRKKNLGKVVCVLLVEDGLQIFDFVGQRLFLTVFISAGVFLDVAVVFCAEIHSRFSRNLHREAFQNRFCRICALLLCITLKKTFGRILFMLKFKSG